MSETFTPPAEELPGAPGAEKRPYVVLKPVLKQFAGHIVLFTDASARLAGDSVRPATPEDLAIFGRPPIDPAG
jgi:hypothetical protein